MIHAKSASWPVGYAASPSPERRPRYFSFLFYINLLPRCYSLLVGPTSKVSNESRNHWAVLNELTAVIVNAWSCAFNDIFDYDLSAEYFVDERG